MKSCSYFQERRNPTTSTRHTRGRSRDSHEDLENCALAGTVAPDDPERTTIRHGEADIAQRPQFEWRRSAKVSQAVQRLAQVATLSQPVALADMLDLNPVHVR